MNQTNAQQPPALGVPVDHTVSPHHGTLAHGWYWVRYERSNCDLTDPQPALWNGHQWRSVGWSRQRQDGALVLEPCHPPGRDPLQGAADWLCKAHDDPDVAMLQRQLWLGYNRSARLFAQAMANAG